MSVFQVWAPDAEAVELVVGDERRAMLRAERPPASRDRAWRAHPGRSAGWWTLNAPELGAGTDYAFSLDGGPPRPDPRSRWQPQGVHGPSRVVERRVAPERAGWRGFHLPSAVLYELHIGTFTPEGTFHAAIERLDHLVSLGVTAVSLMPVNAFSGSHGWGYDGVALFAVHDPYGGPDGLTRFVDACHTRGLGVVLDVVYNHLGPSGNYLGEFGPYFTDRYGTPWGEAVNFDGSGSDEVRRFFMDNALMWLSEYGLDGLRLDAVHAIVDTSAVHILEDLAVEVEILSRAEGRPLWLIAESDLNDPRLLWSRERGGYGLHAQWSDDFHHAVHAAITGETDGYYADFGALGDIATALRNAYVYAGRHAGHRGRRHGRPARGLGGDRFLGYVQNHDQVGNRARGERLSHLVGPDLQKVAATLVLTAPFIPMIFQGEEWAASSPFQYFTDHPDPELGDAVREGRRGEFASFGWSPDEVPDPQDPATFQRSKLRWAERDQDPHGDVASWYRRLIAFRRSRPDLLDGRLGAVDVEVDEEARTLAVRRGGAVVCCNLSEESRRIALPSHWPGVTLQLASRDGVATDGQNHVTLPGASAAVLARDGAPRRTG
jgi:maltooligosyltrehalose trehalohydrolase